MRFLADTHLLLRGASEPSELPKSARALMDDPDAEAWFSVASIWEVAIKHMLGGEGLDVDPGLLRRGLLAHDWRELRIESQHALALTKLPPIHKDPFDRILIAQAKVEGLTLLTGDADVARYPGDVIKV